MCVFVLAAHNGEPEVPLFDLSKKKCVSVISPLPPPLPSVRAVDVTRINNWLKRLVTDAFIPDGNPPILRLLKKMLATFNFSYKDDHPVFNLMCKRITPQNY